MISLEASSCLFKNTVKIFIKLNLFIFDWTFFFNNLILFLLNWTNLNLFMLIVNWFLLNWKFWFSIKLKLTDQSAKFRDDEKLMYGYWLACVFQMIEESSRTARIPSGFHPEINYWIHISITENELYKKYSTPCTALLVFSWI